MMSSRLYAVLLSGCICILILFYGFSQQTISETVVLPSLGQFERLEALYPTTISCPCRQIAVPFLNFSIVSFTSHPVSVTTSPLLNVYFLFYPGMFE